MCFYHCDTYTPNRILTDRDETILVDWEYVGNSDPGCDMGTYTIDYMWQVDESEEFIREYCREDNSQRLLQLACTAILCYYYYVWTLYREAYGAVIGGSLYNWHIIAIRYSRYLVEKYRLQMLE